MAQNGVQNTEDYRIDYNPDDMEEERKNFLKIIAAFRLYRTTSMMSVNHREAYLNSLPDRHQDMLVHFRNNLNRIRDCIDSNYRVVRQLIQTADRLFINDAETSMTKDPQNACEAALVRGHDIEKVQITLKQIARDWSAEGEEERRQCYKPIIDEILRQFDPDKSDVSKIKILVPGAGLGRLIYDLACYGFFCEGNEFSLFMLIASNFVLNRCVVENEYVLYPHVHQFVNNLNRADQTRPITFPDVSPTQRPPQGVMNMVAGDFLQVYVEPEEWNCVASCFFIDCANNIVEFIESIYNILKPDGVWVNLGPLLYHYSDIVGEHSIEPSFEDVVLIIKTVGFEIVKCETGIKTKYSQNPKSMHQSEYESVFFVCRKPAIASTSSSAPKPSETMATDGDELRN